MNQERKKDKMKQRKKQKVKERKENLKPDK